MIVNSLHENYLMSVMSPRQVFNVQCTFYINGEFKAVSGKLDTGCTKTLISADAIYSLYNVQEMKKRDILDVLRNGGEFSHGFGVETDISKYVPPKTLDEAMNDKTLRFEKPVQDLRINGYRIGDINVRIGYNTSKKVLMGMDVIKRLNSFIGPYNGKLYFLATHSNIVKTADLFEKIMQEVSRLSIDEDKYLDLDGEYDLNDEQAAEAAYINKLLKSNLNRRMTP